jgi:hypothetical protein
MFDKWGVRNKKKGHIKIRIAVNIKTKGILGLEVADKAVHDSRIMKRLVRPVLDDHDGENEGIKSVLYDGAYDSDENFKILNDNGIEPAIKA